MALLHAPQVRFIFCGISRKMLHTAPPCFIKPHRRFVTEAHIDFPLEISGTGIL
jgi:hypothetical protein